MAYPPVYSPDLAERLPFRRYPRRVQHVEAIRLEGPFEVVTPHGRVACADGWLARDSGGDLYPLSAEEFARIADPEPLPRPAA